MSLIMGPSSRSFLMASHQESGARREESERPGVELHCRTLRDPGRRALGGSAGGKGPAAVLLLGDPEGWLASGRGSSGPPERAGEGCLLR